MEYCSLLTFCVVFFFFFFFKQKTAYEIYQCDWSSDVCSSDLELEKGVKLLNLITNRTIARMKSKRRIPSLNVRPEIGRASCRERV